MIIHYYLSIKSTGILWETFHPEKGFQTNNRDIHKKKFMRVFYN